MDASNFLLRRKWAILVFHRRPKLYDNNREAKLPQASDAKNLDFFAEFRNKSKERIESGIGKFPTAKKLKEFCMNFSF